jgi:hypothetical protein
MPKRTPSTEVKDVPPEKVGTKVRQLVQTGASKIECTKQDDGKWTIRAS